MIRKLPSAPPQEVEPFVKNDVVTITTIEENGRITSFKATYKGQEKIFHVKKDFNILAAWKQVEQFTADIR